MRIPLPPLFCAIAGVLATGTPVAAQPHHHRHQLMQAPPANLAPRHDANEFYPNEIEGGVSGNLPFNNQIRKLRDPLNANGAGR